MHYFGVAYKFFSIYRLDIVGWFRRQFFYVSAGFLCHSSVICRKGDAEESDCNCLVKLISFGFMYLKALRLVHIPLGLLHLLMDQSFIIMVLAARRRSLQSAAGTGEEGAGRLSNRLFSGE